ncbi:hypothetical protein M3649_13480 [Ureibacillus chungkukjangi]|uniref:hypothetical protein n=1 Tax=Ureibacillus chungkukjangi TaxID=1202712 RepID=UPI00203E7F41|nr:hypothetical protein [Ureibacillus chungkukjangi]MCM3389148.1 hypothetical protein [Ureibacillus chungkukjangi]
MKHLNTILRISEVLHQKYGYYVPIREIGYESNLFYKDELDENLVPLEVVDHLVEPFMTVAASYTDVEGNYFLVIQVETGAVEP